MKWYVISEARLKEIANAIRRKTGTSNKMTPSQMVDAIAGISSKDDMDRLISRTGTEVSSESVKSIGANAFYNYITIQSAVFPLVETIGNDAFSGCSALRNVVLPVLRSLGARAFYNCASLQTLDLRSSSLSSIPSNSFYGSNLNAIWLPSSVFCSATNSSFAGCPLASGGSGGTIYLPAKYRTTYEANSGWSSVIRSPNNRIITY